MSPFELIGRYLVEMGDIRIFASLRENCLLNRYFGMLCGVYVQHINIFTRILSAIKGELFESYRNLERFIVVHTRHLSKISKAIKRAEKTMEIN